MITVDELLRTLRSALADEREGILRCDSGLITRAIHAKESVLTRLHQTPAAERRPLLEALEWLQRELFENQILMERAKAYLQDNAEDRVPSSVPQ